MVATNVVVGCVGHKSMLDAVDFAATAKKHPLHHLPTTTNHTPRRRSDRLHDKEALLFNSRSKNGIIHSHNKRMMHQPDDDDDWGVTPSRRSGASTPLVSNKSSHLTNKSPINNRSSLLHHHHPNNTPKSSENNKLLFSTPPSSTERIRSFETRGRNLSTTRSITPKGASEPGSWTLRSKKSRSKYQEEEEPMADVTSRHHNHVVEKQPNRGPALFQSARRAKASVATQQERKPKPNKKKKKEFTLFEHSRKEFDEKDKRRMETIVQTVRSLEVSQASSSGMMKMGKAKVKRDDDNEEDTEDTWDTDHYIATEKLNAALDPVEQFRDVYKEDYEKHNNSRGSASSKPARSVTDWGIEAIVSDLSLSSNSALDTTTSSIPVTNGIPHNLPQPMNATTQKIQKALANAKNQIYPDDSTSAHTSNAAASASTSGEEDDKYIMEQDENDAFDKAARKRLAAGKRAKASGKSAMRQDALDHNSKIHNGTPKHSNMTQKAKFQAFGAALPHNLPKVHRARSSSPDAMKALAPPKRSSKRQSKTPEKSTRPTVSSVLSDETPLYLKSSLPLGKSRSATPTKDRRHLSTTQSKDSSVTVPRSLTPTQLESSRRRPTPGQLLGECAHYIDDAEEKLKAIKYQREMAQYAHAEEEFYKRPKAKSKRGLMKSFSGSGDILFSGQRRGIKKSFSGSGENLFSLQRRGIVKKPNSNNIKTSGLGQAGGYSAGSRSSGGNDQNYTGSPREPPSKRWFGRGRLEVPARAPKSDQITSSAGRSAKNKSVGSPVASVLRSDGESRGGNNTDQRKMSDRMRRHMLTFDSLMQAIENDKKNKLGAEFAVVELGDEDNAVQTHAILMNREDVEDQLGLLGPKQRFR